MPLVWIGLGALGIGGLYLSKGTFDSMSNLTKWLILGAVVYGAGKFAKVW